jgi:hypothetical protein
VAAEGVPLQSRVLYAQGFEGGSGQALPPVLFAGGGRLLNPAKSAAAAGLLVNPEYLGPVQVGGSLPPAMAFPGPCAAPDCPGGGNVAPVRPFQHAPQA